MKVLLAVACVFGAAGLFGAAEVSVADLGGDVNAAVARVAAAGGGRVVVPKGDWATPSVKLLSHVELHLAEGARLVASTNRRDYTSLGLPFCEGDLMAVVTAVGATDVAITGAGEVFGNGQAWPQPGSYGGNQEGTRPRGIVFANCRDVRLEGFTLRDSPCWGIVIKNCDGVVARRVRIDSHCNANNDGFDVEARNVLIEDCDVDSGDDAFCLKSNDPGFVMENVTIRRCVGRSNCNAFKIGTASHGVVRGIRFEDCRVEAPRRDFLSRISAPNRPKPGQEWFRHNRTHEWAGGPDHLAGMAGIAVECVDGGEVSDVSCRNFTIRGAMAPIFVRGGTRTGRSCGTPPGNRYVLRDIRFANIDAVSESYVASSITGVKGCRPARVRLENVTIRCKPGKMPPFKGPVPECAGSYPEANRFGVLPTKGLYIRHADDVELRNVTVSDAAGDPDARVVCEDVTGLREVAAAADAELDLAGTWKLERADDASVTCPIAVPGGVHAALREAGLMPDPFWGQNEREVQEIGRRDWIVSRTFDVGAEILAKKAVVLRLEDVDTFATIVLNGHELGKTDNRFRRWEYDVKPYLKAGRNELKGVFRSSENRANELAKGYDHVYPMSNVPWAKNQALIRKPACHAGWDWGLALMVTGFCGETKILAYDDCKVDYVYSTQAFNDDFTHCDLTVFAEATDADGRAFTVTNRFAIDNPPLWWPNGAGPQRFYAYTVRVGAKTLSRKVGLRKVEVLNTPDTDESGKPGARMAFRVNGREMFMKGANWIPCSAFENEQTPARYRDLLESAAAANMNMVRLWGGGQFEKDVFYDLCDEMGLLLWHDFMFSCATYPGDAAFLGTVRGELSHQLRRLRDHASIAMWCGDNECVGALNWYDETRADKPFYKKALEARHAVSDACVAAYDPQRAFWPSSPCAGPGNYADNWKNDSQGDMHNWQVWHANKSFDEYYRYRPRFCSEFGYQSFSSREVAETFCAAKDLNPTSPDFEWHQKNRGGNPRMLETMARYFRFPQGTDAMLYLSQVQQAIAIKTAVEGWRAQRPRCMGTLFWQLNDNWPVASWSSVEYGGKWKHLQHQARRFFAPLAAVGVPGTRAKTARVVVLNDTAASVDAEVAAEYWSFDGRVLKARTARLRLAPDSATDWGAGELAADAVAEPAFVVLTLKTKAGTFRNEWLFDYYKTYDLAEADVKATFDGLKVTLATDRPAFFVWANAKGVPGEFSDNSFTLLPGRPVTLAFEPKRPVSPEAFRRAFALTHLRQTY